MIFSLRLPPPFNHTSIPSIFLFLHFIGLPSPSFFPLSRFHLPLSSLYSASISLFLPFIALPSPSFFPLSRFHLPLSSLYRASISIFLHFIALPSPSFCILSGFFSISLNFPRCSLIFTLFSCFHQLISENLYVCSALVHLFVF